MERWTDWQTDRQVGGQGIWTEETYRKMDGHMPELLSSTVLFVPSFILMVIFLSTVTVIFGVSSFILVSPATLKLATVSITFCRVLSNLRAVALALQ